jgi:hypothetical protein
MTISVFSFRTWSLRNSRPRNGTFMSPGTPDTETFSRSCMRPPITSEWRSGSRTVERVSRWSMMGCGPRSGRLCVNPTTDETEGCTSMVTTPSSPTEAVTSRSMPASSNCSSNSVSGTPPSCVTVFVR